MTGGKEKRKGFWREGFEPYLLLIPAIVLLITLILWPILKSFSYALMEYSLIKPDKTAYIGFDNFRAMMGDDLFWRSLNTSARYAVSVVAFQFVIGLGMALLMRSMKRLRGVYRAAVFAPWAVSGVLTAIIWKMIFNGTYGVVNDLLLRAGLVEEPIPWGTTGSSAFLIVVVASVWRGIPYFAISMLAGLTSIPEEMYESGRIDGAGAFRLFCTITLPYLRETIILTTLLRLIWTFNDVDIVYSLTAGGPNNATLTLPVYVSRTAVEFLNFGYGSALAIGLCVVLLVFSVVYLQFGRSSDDFSA